MKPTYDNPTRRQCEDLARLALPQFDAALAALGPLLRSPALGRVRKIVVTGCGDSYLAAAQAQGAFDKYLAGTGCSYTSVRAMDAARYMNLEADGPRTMLVVVSASGGAARVAEILERGNRYGCMTVALTNNRDSRAAALAACTYCTNTPEFADTMPGLRSYYASLLALIVLAAALGERLGGQITALQGLRQALGAYNSQYAAAFAAADSAALDAAVAWKELKGFEVTADGPLLACGEFIAAKYAEVSGDMCSVVDSENYCHVNSIIRPGAAYGTLALALAGEANVSRLAATVNQQVEKDARPVLLVADRPAAGLGITAPVRQCTLPTPPTGFAFIYLLYAYVPGSLAAAYHAALLNEPYFRGGGIFSDPAVNTLKTNPIRIL